MFLRTLPIVQYTSSVTEEVAMHELITLHNMEKLAHEVPLVDSTEPAKHQTPLMIAALLGHGSVIHLLLKSKAKVNEADSNG